MIEREFKVWVVLLVEKSRVELLVLLDVVGLRVEWAITSAREAEVRAPSHCM